MAGPDDGTVWIVSTRDPDRNPVCEITWGTERWYASVADVRATAIDLLTCAAYAEMMLQLVVIGLPPAQVSAFASDLLSGKGRTMFGTKSTLELIPAGSSKRREALVLLSRKSDRAAVTAYEARGMALAWLQVAEATESDQLVAEALRATGTADEAATEKVFGYLRELRGKAHE